MTKCTTQAEKAYCGWPFRSSAPPGIVFMQAEACRSLEARSNKAENDDRYSASFLLFINPGLYPRLGLAYLYQLNKDIL